MKIQALSSLMLIPFILFSSGCLRDTAEEIGMKHGSTLNGKLIGRKDIQRKEDISWSTDWASPGGHGKIFTDGTYEFTDLRPGRYRICYRGDNIMPTYYIAELLPGENTLNIDLPTCTINGEIRAPKDGMPQQRSPDPLQIKVIRHGTTVGSGNRVASISADRTGSFYLDHVPAGDYIIRWDKHNEYVARLTVDSRQDREHVILEPPIATASLEGEIRFEDDEKSSVSVHAFPKSEFGYDITAWNTVSVIESPYQYQIDNLPSGTYGIYVTSDGFFGDTPRVFIPEIEIGADSKKKVDIDIPQGRKVKIQIDYSEGKPSRARWDLVYPSGAALPDQAFVGSKPEGFFASQSEFVLPFGRYEVKSRFDGQITKTHEFYLTKGEDVFQVKITAPVTNLADWAKRN